MKKVLFILVFAIVSLGLSAKVVCPVKYDWTVDHIPDGKYYVNVDWKTAKAANDGCYLTFEVFIPDRYTASMLNNLAVGDIIHLKNKTIKVVNRIKENDMYIVNYEEGEEYTGTYFAIYDQLGYYVPCEETIAPEDFFNSCGKVTLKVLKFSTEYGDESLNAVVKGARISNYIIRNWKKAHFRNLGWSYITVKDGKVVLLESICAA